MEENRFERQVRQKLDELKIHPSDTVWEKIAARIEKKKRSNRGIFLFGLLFFALLSGGYLLWNNGRHPMTTYNNSEKTNANSDKTNPEKINSGNTANETAIKENKAVQQEPDSIGRSIQHESNARNGAALSKKYIKISSPSYYRPVAKEIAKVSPGGKTVIAFSKRSEADDAVSEDADAVAGKVKREGIPVENEKSTGEIKDRSYDNHITNKDSLLKQSSVQNEKDRIMDTMQQPTSPAIVKQGKKNKWRLGLLLLGGFSGVGNDFLGFANTVSFDYLNAVGQRPPGSTPGTTAPAAPARTGSAFGFAAGMSLEKNISKKVIFLTGINFKSFNTSTRVGRRNDSTGFYYSANTAGIYNTARIYRSYYHFIELPITLKVQIGQHTKMPWYWQGGLVVSQLLSTNALQFNQNSGSYYRDNSAFNKTQIGLNTSFSASLFSKQKNSVLIGPYFYYSVSSLANEGLYNKKHFVFTGLRTEIIFGK